MPRLRKLASRCRRAHRALIRLLQSAKKVLFAWGTQGFRDQQGRVLTQQNQLCDRNGNHADVADAGLAISRGIVYSVHAQDLLMYCGALDESEARALSAFHSAIFVLLLDSLNNNYDRCACDHYDNHSANSCRTPGNGATGRQPGASRRGVVGPTPIDARRFAVDRLFRSAIYCEADLPNSCRFNSGSDSYTSHPFFSTAVVAPGEIDDRFRNKGTGQGIGSDVHAGTARQCRRDPAHCRL
jgi:hypothetical protein